MTESSGERPAPSALGSWLTLPRFAILLLLFILAMFPEVIFGGRTFFYRDFSIFGYPLAHHLRESLWHGEVPLWNPLNNGGIPFLAQWNTMCLYPLSLFFVLLPLSWSLAVFCIAHAYLGGIGMYLLAHRWTGHRLAAAIAGMIYAFNGFAWYALLWPNIIGALGWAPFVLLTLDLARSGGRRSILLAALVGSLQMLTGGMEVILLTWLGATAVTAMNSVNLRPWSIQWRTAARFGAVVLLVTGLCAAQLLPFLSFVAHSQRGSAYADGQWPMPVNGWANFLLPLFGTVRSFHDVHVQGAQQYTCSYYLGIVTVVFALFALRGWRDKRVWVLWSLIAFATLFALGDQSPIYRGVRAALPWIGAIRYPVKFLLLPVIVLPLLAALGAANFFGSARPKTSWRALVGVGAGVSIVVACLAWWGSAHQLRPSVPAPLFMNAAMRVTLLALFIATLGVLVRCPEQKWSMALVVIGLAILWIDNRTHVPKLNPTVERSVYESGLVRQYLKLPELVVQARSRMMPSYDALSKLQRTSVTSAEDECIGRRLALCGNLNLLDGIAKLDGTFALYPRETAEFNDLLYSMAQRERAPLKDFVGASYITAPGGLIEWVCRESALPLATGGQQPIFASETDTLRGLDDPSFDPKRFVYLPNSDATSVSTNLGTARIMEQSFTAHAADLVVEASAPSLVVIAQSYYYCWRAAIDGAPVKLLRANHAFQAVQVPEGKHQITLRYRDTLFTVGVWISLCCLVGIVARACGPQVTRACGPQMKH